MRVSNIPEPVCDLVETRSAQHTIPRRKLWGWVFAAMLSEDLHPDGMSLETETRHAATAKPFTLSQLINHELRQWEQHNQDPCCWSWINSIKFSPLDFDAWLNARRFAPHGNKRRGANSAKSDAVRKVLATGAHVGRTNKEIVILVKQHHKIDVSERTVRRARGLK